MVVPFILGGAMGPVTLAGAIAQAHAETLVGVALGQLTRPGSPVIYGNFLSSMALRIGLARRSARPSRPSARWWSASWPGGWGLPLRCSGAFTSSKVPDGQAMQESRGVACRPAVLCGANFILHSAGWLEGGLAMGYEKFVMDVDFCGALHTYLPGIDLAEDQFALDGFVEVGPGKHFFGSQHTLRHYETAFWDSGWPTTTRSSSGGTPARRRVEDRAAERVAAMLANYEAPPIDAAVDEALLDFVARRKADMPDKWH